ncbi:MAG: hypothetical protein AABX75_00195 [Nanoarchaeota archaeon]
MLFRIVESEKKDFVSFIDNINKNRDFARLMAKIYPNLHTLTGKRQAHKSFWRQNAGLRAEAKKTAYKLIFLDFDKKLEILTGKPWLPERCNLCFVPENETHSTQEGVNFGYLAESDFENTKLKFAQALAEFKFNSENLKAKKQTIREIVKILVQ